MWRGRESRNILPTSRGRVLHWLITRLVGKHDPRAFRLRILRVVLILELELRLVGLEKQGVILIIDHRTGNRKSSLISSGGPETVLPIAAAHLPQDIMVSHVGHVISNVVSVDGWISGCREEEGININTGRPANTGDHATTSYRPGGVSLTADASIHQVTSPIRAQVRPGMTEGVEKIHL
jgi:hypothetical protein